MQITIRIETIMPLVLVTRLMKIIFNYPKYHLTSSLWCFFCGAYSRMSTIISCHSLFLSRIPRFSLSISLRSFACVLHVPCGTRGRHGKIEINFNETLFRALLSLKSKRLGYKVLPTHPQQLCGILSLFSHIFFCLFVRLFPFVFSVCTRHFYRHLHHQSLNWIKTMRRNAKIMER